MLEPPVPLENLTVVLIIYISVWTATFLVLWYYLEKQRGLKPREQRGWLISFLAPMFALLVWLIGFSTLEAVAMGLVAVPFFYVLIEAAAKIEDMKQDDDRNRGPGVG